MRFSKQWLAAVAVCLFVGCGGSDGNQKAGGGAGSATGSGSGGGAAAAAGAADAKSESSADLKSLTGTVQVDGSSTVYLVTEAVAAAFQKASKVKVKVGISGTGGGFKKFCRGEIDICDASRPILKAEMDAAKEAK